MSSDPSRSSDPPTPNPETEEPTVSAGAALARLPRSVTEALQAMRGEFERFDLEYRSALAVVEARLEVLRDEFTHVHDYNPIEHIATRVKSAQSILRKAQRRGLSLDLDLERMRALITDIAGARVVVSFTADVYRVFHLITQMPDIELLQVEDYVAHPKPSGYRSLHCLVNVPIHLSTGRTHVVVEVQIRTIAMDFWASLEHKIHYKFDDQDIPPAIVSELTEAARVAAEMDARMEHLHRMVHPRAGEDAQDDGLFPTDLLYSPQGCPQDDPQMGKNTSV